MLGLALASLLATVAAAPPPMEFPVSWWHNRQTVEVSVADRVTVALECRPGTGERWREVVGDRSILVELEPSRSVPLLDDVTGRPDGRERQVFSYLAARPGVTRWTATRGRWSVAAGPGPVRPDAFEVTVEVRRPK